MDKIELPILKGDYKKKYIPYTLIIGIIILVVLLLLTCLSLTFKKNYKINYSDTSNLDYRVYLKKNTDFQEEYLGKDKEYIASLINYIEADFDYSFDCDTDLDMLYSYYITATLDIRTPEGKPVYEKEDYLVEESTFEENKNKKFSIKETVKVNYPLYNKLASNFLDKYGLTSNANLILSLHVNLKGNNNEFNKQIDDSGVVRMVIPLVSNTVDISMDYSLSNNKDATLQYKQTIIENKVLFAICIFLIVFELIGIALIIIYILSKRDERDLYEAELKKITREYSRYISKTVITQRVEDMIKTQSLRIEIVSTFQDLMDIRDSLNTQILYHEERSGAETVFYIISDRVGYIYVMSVDDFKKKKGTKSKPTDEKGNLLDSIKNGDISDIITPLKKKSKTINVDSIIVKKIEDENLKVENMVIQNVEPTETIPEEEKELKKKVWKQKKHNKKNKS